MTDAPDLVRDDGSLWTASYNPEDSFVSLFDDTKRFYFLEIVPNHEPKPCWWEFWKKKPPDYVRTGKIWEGGPRIADGNFSFHESYWDRWGKK